MINTARPSDYALDELRGFGDRPVWINPLWFWECHSDAPEGSVMRTFVVLPVRIGEQCLPSRRGHGGPYSSAGSPIGSDRKRLFFITLVVYLLATTATALSWNIWSFVLFRFLTAPASVENTSLCRQLSGSPRGFMH